jgi:transcription antitermination factor NusG|tara:strand:+ start:397 stop:621 length:225 start_codon:yes stop_codon:yes gene_type:complete
MKVGDLVKIKKGCFMQGKMGIVVKRSPDAKHQAKWCVQLIGNNVPASLKHRPIPYRPARVIVIKSSNDRDNKKS